MQYSGFIHRVALLALYFAFLVNKVLGDDCRPITWAAKRDVATADHAEPSGMASPPFNINVVMQGTNETVQPGEVICRYFGHTSDAVNYYTCKQLSNFYQISLDDFFTLNPDVQKDCSNIKPLSEYCVRGYIQPVVSTDGFCGPQHGNATCQLTQMPCCNAQTWTCGNTTDDCAPGNCWDGACEGHTIYSTDGKCGVQNNNLLCAGRWGNCCSLTGVCGNGTDFCGDGRCQSGDCLSPIAPPPPPPPSNSTLETPDGTCGPSKGYICDVEWGFCCNKDNFCGSLPQDCSPSHGCQSKYGTCDTGTGTTTKPSSSSRTLSHSTSSIASSITSSAVRSTTKTAASTTRP